METLNHRPPHAGAVVQHRLGHAARLSQPSHQPRSPIPLLPNELYIIIFSFMSPAQLRKCMQCSKAFHALAFYVYSAHIYPLKVSDILVSHARSTAAGLGTIAVFARVCSVDAKMAKIEFLEKKLVDSATHAGVLCQKESPDPAKILKTDLGKRVWVRRDTKGAAFQVRATGFEFYGHPMKLGSCITFRLWDGHPVETHILRYKNA
ncbi:uncharacterized protein BJ171DRAFT_585291 [Polychytrium aggregatum]|uniref:uncharacterized protein n=1 Tax=Polychytrium aggregatum TaxID=110093 RepID=UPI0022FE2A4F|nr:uncharacterized protein BJ171DRAFT_585291 [Polychytrium aggregatum]KAI9199496.1 hypothetical protein BJ171DRAFT_585291 [Polychytrium aggregatum]